MNKVDLVSELYSPLLATLHVTPDETGVLRRVHGDNIKICEVNKRKLALPTANNLQHLSQNEYIFFHPLSENFARGDSAIFNYYKSLITLRVNYTIVGLASVLLSIAGDKQLDGKLNSSQLGLVTAVPKVDKKAIDNFISLANTTDLDNNTFFSVYNRRNGKINGATYHRVAVVRFPLIEQLSDPSNSQFWKSVKNIRKSDYVTYQSLLNYILPNNEIENSYSGYSDSLEAPSFQAMTMAYVTIMKRLSEVASLFSDVAEMEDLIIPELGTIEQSIANLARFANIIPPLDGNIGEVAQKDTPANKIQQNPIGVPPSSLLESADKKLNQMANQNPHPSQGGYPQQQQHPVAPQTPPPQPQGFIGMPNQYPNPMGYPPQGGYPHQGGYPPQGGYPNPAYPPQGGGFITYPTNQGGYYGAPPQGYPPQAPATTLDPIQSWNAEVTTMQNPNPAYGYAPPPFYPQGNGGYPNPAYPPQGGYPQQGFGYPQQGYPQQPYPPQGYPPQTPMMGAYGAPPRTFRKVGEGQIAGDQQLPQTFQGK